MQKILCAAIWYKEVNLINPEAISSRGSQPFNITEGIVICGWRHHCIIHMYSAITGERDCERGDNIQGFLTNDNLFVTREDAATIAFKAGQTKEYHGRLYSEDLY